MEGQWMGNGVFFSSYSSGSFSGAVYSLLGELTDIGRQVRPLKQPRNTVLDGKNSPRLASGGAYEGSTSRS